MKDNNLPEVLQIHTPELFATAVCRVADMLRAGGVVALPTETVYGLAANALNPEAMRKVFEIKGRPLHNPIIVHVAGMEMARACTSEWPRWADELASAFWPGPLTLVMSRASSIPDLVTAGGLTVGLRWPRHPFIQKVIQTCGFPLAAPSANPAGQISATHPWHVQKTLGSRIPLIVDGGPCQIGIESTVVDLTTRPPRVLRPGMIGLASLLAVAEEVGGAAGTDPAILRSPGLLARHYAPQAKLGLWHWADDQDLARQVARLPVAQTAVHIIAHTRIPSRAGYGRVVVMPHDPEAFARAIYAELHTCDEAGARWIVVEALPGTEAWLAISDRLGRAAH